MHQGRTLRALIVDAHRGVFPLVNGGWERIAPWRAGLGAVIAFTGHAFLAVDEDVSDEELHRLAPGGYGGAHAPHVVQSLAGADGWIDSLDAVLVGGPQTHLPRSLVERRDLESHPRVQLARRLRDDVRVLGFSDPGISALVTVGRGLGGLLELGIETDGGVDAVAMIREASMAAPEDEPVVAAVAPGNARALRTVLAAGFRPIASVQLYQRS